MEETPSQCLLSECLKGSCEGTQVARGDLGSGNSETCPQQLPVRSHGGRAGKVNVHLEGSQAGICEGYVL